MIRRILAGFVFTYMIVVTVLPFTFKGIIDDGAVRYKNYGDVYYFDFDEYLDDYLNPYHL